MNDNEMLDHYIKLRKDKIIYDANMLNQAEPTDKYYEAYKGQLEVDKRYLRWMLELRRYRKTSGVM